MLTEQQIKEMAETGNAERARLLPFFEKVHDPADWKAPIRAMVPDTELQSFKDAIVFFTATEPREERSGIPGYVILSSEGYRRGPAGDH